MMFMSLEQAISLKEVIEHDAQNIPKKLFGKLLPIMCNGGRDFVCAKRDLFCTSLYYYSGDFGKVSKHKLTLNEYLKSIFKDIVRGPLRGTNHNIKVSEIEYRSGVEIAADAWLAIDDTENYEITIARGFSGDGTVHLPDFNENSCIDQPNGIESEALDNLLCDLADLVLPPMEKLAKNVKTGEMEIDWNNRVSPDLKDKAEKDFKNKAFSWQTNRWRPEA